MWELFTYPSLIVLAGFMFVRTFGAGWDIVSNSLMVSFCFIACCVALRILLDSVIIMFRTELYMQGKQQDRLVVVNSNQHQFVVDKVVYDMEKVLARALMEFPENLTEEYWIKSGRWKSMGGTGRDQFVEILRGWEARGIIARRNPNVKNSPYFIPNRHILVRVAAGRYSPANNSPTAQNGKL